MDDLSNTLSATVQVQGSAIIDKGVLQNLKSINFDRPIIKHDSGLYTTRTNNSQGEDINMVMTPRIV